MEGLVNANRLVFGGNDIFTLNTGMTCFLCLNDPMFSGDNCSVRIEADIPPETFSLLGICRFLNIDAKEVISNWQHPIPNMGGEELVGKMPNISVTLCKPCSSSVSKLSSLCQELEILQMKISDCIGTLDGILKDSDVSLGRAHRFKNLVISGVMTPTHGHVANVLRREMKNKCSSRLRRASPRVTVTTEPQQLARPPLFIPPGVTNCDEESIPFVIPPPPTRKRKITPAPAEDPLTADVQMSEIRNAPSASSSTSNGRIDRKISCELCPPSQRPIRARLMKRHKIMKHLETLFPSIKLPHLSQSEFKDYCDHAIHLQVISASRTQNAAGNPACQCPNCANVYCNHDALRYHIFADHEQILATKITELQRTSSIEEIRSIKLPTSCFSQEDRWTCLECGKTFAQQCSLSIHKKGRCRAANRVKIKHKCAICGALLSGPGHLRRHEKLVHGKAKKQDQNLSEILPTLFSGSSGQAQHDYSPFDSSQVKVEFSESPVDGGEEMDEDFQQAILIKSESGEDY